VAEIAAGFQEAVVDVLVTKTVRVAEATGARCVLLSGGVAANSRLREELVRRSRAPVWAPPISLCTDNGAMIAAAGHYRAESGAAGLDLDVRASWPLDSMSAVQHISQSAVQHISQSAVQHIS
jgi:N6-L-threonylcarbamoyladenine synthase